MRGLICARNIPAKFYSDPIQKDEDFGLFEAGRPNKKNKKKTGRDMRSVPDLKRLIEFRLTQIEVQNAVPD